MLEFILGIIVGIFIIIPTILIVTICYFPMKVQHGFKKPTQPHITPSPSHKSPYLYKIFQPTTSTTTPSTATSQQQKPSIRPQQDTTSDLLTTTRDEIITKLHKYTNGESLHWLNLFLITGLSTIKKILYESDDKVIKLCNELGVSTTGTFDSNYNMISTNDISNNNTNTPPTTTTTNDNTTSQQQPQQQQQQQQQQQNQPLTTKMPINSGSKTILPILNRLLIAKLQTMPFLGPTRITYLDFNAILPQIHNIHLIDYDITTNCLVFDISLSFITDSIIEVDLSIDLQYEKLLVATIPTQVALANFFTSLTLRIAVDLDFSTISSLTTPQPTTTTTSITTTNTNNDINNDSTQIDAINDIINQPSISISLVEPPILRFDLATSIGYNYWISNIPFLHTLLHKGLMLGMSSIIAPNYKTFLIPSDIKDDFIHELCQLAVGKKKI